MGKVINMVGGGSGSGGGTVTITDTLDTHGGTIRTITTDPAATIIEALNATANDTYTAPAGHAYSPVVVNVAGGGSLVTEEGTWTASSDTNDPTISFANTHTNEPTYIVLIRTSANLSSASLSAWGHIDSNKILGQPFKYGSTDEYCFQLLFTASTGGGGNNITQIKSYSGGTSYSRDYYVTNTGFRPHYQVYSGQTFKWQAAWID